MHTFVSVNVISQIDTPGTPHGVD